MHVNVDYDPRASFENLSTYRWLDSAEVSEDLEAISPFLERRIRRSVDEYLETSGFMQRADQDTDFMVTAFVVVPDGEGVERCPARSSCGPFAGFFTMGYGYPYGYGFRYPWYRYRFPYRRYPWGYAYSYRIGFGYTWIPVYDRPDGKLPGTLVVDVYDANQELIWRGSAEGALLDARAQHVTRDYLDGVIASILERFPPTS